MPNRSLLDPILIAQLGNLHLRAKRILDGLYSGHHTNPVIGVSQEFSQHRPYNAGDDLKLLDWKAFGRTERLVVKQHEEETNIAATVIIDDSASMGFSYGKNIPKLEYVKTMAAALGYLLVSQHDGIGLLSRELYLPPRNHRSHLDLFFKRLEGMNPHGQLSLGNSIDQITAPVRHRSFVLVFSDLMEEPEKMVSALRTLYARKHEVIIFQVLDPAEKDLTFSGPILFEDMETGETLKTEPDSIRESYRQLVDERLAYFSHVFHGAGMEYVCLTTDTPFNKGLGAYLTWRAARI